ncbi:MAG: hypothetical protein RL719_191 [Actinomycetota bacterium]
MAKSTVEFQASASYFARLLTPFLLCIALSAPALMIHFGLLQASALVAAICMGVAIIAAAFMLGWIGEAAELDLSGGLAIGLLAVIAILPEYVVSTVISFQAGSDAAMAPLATANLTGANRLLLGFGWPVVALFGWIAFRRSQQKKKFGIELEPESKTDIGFMIWATIISFAVPLTGEIDLIIGLLMVVLFVSYLWRVSEQKNEEPELEGTAAYVGALPKWWRRSFLLGIAVIAAGIILICAEPFTENLLVAGEEMNWNSYLLIQWITPLASEAPEFTLAFLFAAKGKAQVALAVLISSKVNQWSVLAGSLPIAYILGGGQGAGIPLDVQSVSQFNLTIAQSILGIALVLSMRVGRSTSAILLGTFILTFIFTDVASHDLISLLCLAISIPFFVANRKLLLPAIKAPFSKTINPGN